jgi:predicted adenylyl cyclase CyaB
MSQNIEIKAETINIKRLYSLLENLGATFVSEMIQEDTYFNTQTSKRLKLRNIDNEKFVLISYERPNTVSEKVSDWRSVSFEEKDKIFELLTFTFGIKVIVKKTRKVYQYKNTEIHLDQVEGLGNFVELETKVVDESSNAEHLDLIMKLEIDRKDLISESYSDLILNLNK